MWFKAKVSKLNMARGILKTEISPHAGLRTLIPGVRSQMHFSLGVLDFENHIQYSIAVLFL